MSLIVGMAAIWVLPNNTRRKYEIIPGTAGALTKTTAWNDISPEPIIKEVLFVTNCTEQKTMSCVERSQRKLFFYEESICND
jgi:hypothetical protein